MARKIAISSGHGLKIRGAYGSNTGCDEVNEARRIVNEVARMIKNSGGHVVHFHDDTSTSQSQNLDTIVNWHNKQSRDLDVSVHLNAYNPTSGGRGVEVLWVTQETLAKKVSSRIAQEGHLINRGAKKRTDLRFLNSTAKPSILIEALFCDAVVDVENYRHHFEAICAGIAETIAGVAIDVTPPTEPLPPGEETEPLPGDGDALINVTGKMSTFGGPDDMGVSPTEGLAFFQNFMEKPELFLPFQPVNTSGLARRLNTEVSYIAMRWDYSKTPKAMLQGPQMALVRASKTGRAMLAIPADYGPHGNTGRVADLSPSLARNLGIVTDDEVQCFYPYLGNSVGWI